MGNIASLQNSCEKIGIHPSMISTPEELLTCDKVILPGVGSFHDAAEHLRQNALDEGIKAYAKSGKTLFGICLGLQLLFKESEESRGALGLDLIPGDVVHFSSTTPKEQLKIPHMGWNKMFLEKEDALFKGIDNPYLYFVHSYHVRCDDKYSIGKTDYAERFTSAVRFENVIGLQPHPEKSHENGLKILKNFVES
jgi:glutamine amidotransferase